MAVSYNKLWKLLVDKKMSKADLRKAAGLAPQYYDQAPQRRTRSYGCAGKNLWHAGYGLWGYCGIYKRALKHKSTYYQPQRLL